MVLWRGSDRVLADVWDGACPRSAMTRSSCPHPCIAILRQRLFFAGWESGKAMSAEQRPGVSYHTPLRDNLPYWSLGISLLVLSAPLVPSADSAFNYFSSGSSREHAGEDGKAKARGVPKELTWPWLISDARWSMVDARLSILDSHSVGMLPRPIT